MSAARNVEAKISPSSYLAGEKESEARHEYVDGSLYALAGGDFES